LDFYLSEYCDKGTKYSSSLSTIFEGTTPIHLCFNMTWINQVLFILPTVPEIANIVTLGKTNVRQWCCLERI